jgi:phytoene/squalene synthetase
MARIRQWAMNDALCAALQIINHLQDCGKDYRAIEPHLFPVPMLAAAGWMKAPRRIVPARRCWA